MSLEGLRAWIGEVERKLGKRTRVFLALTVIAIGLGGAAIYLAVDARESSVSESDVQELQEELEVQIDAAATGAAAGTAAPVEPEPEATPGTEVEPAPEAQPKADRQGSSGAPESSAGGTGTGGSATGGKTGSAEGGGATSEGGTATGGAGGANVQDLLEQAEESGSEAEKAQGK